MIGYVTLGTNDLPRAAKFYDAIAETQGVARMMGDDNFIAWGQPNGGPGIGLTKPFDGNAATVGNGVMVALAARDRAHVDQIHKLALSLGAQDEGAPGERPGPPGFYAAYFRDPDGNKLNAFVFAGPPRPPMVGYVTLGTNDHGKARAFYDALFETNGARRVFETPTSTVWGGGGAELDLTSPFDGKAATVGNGVMVALECKDRAQVDRVYNRAISLGAKCEGPAGERWPGFYAGYFRDPDGNKLNAFVMG
jgi:predicted lactoylglutathione lyase